MSRRKKPLKMDLREFEQYCEKRGFAAFEFHSDDPDNCEAFDSSFQCSLCFKRIVVRWQTRRVGFIADPQQLCFNRIKYVEVDENDELNVCIKFVCGPSDGEPTRNYTVTTVFPECYEWSSIRQGDGGIQNENV